MTFRHIILHAALLLQICTTLGVAVAVAQPSTPLTVIAIGDAGEPDGELEGNARQMLELARRGQRDNAPVGLLLFVGDNIYPHGLNGMTAEQRAYAVESTLGPHRELMTMLTPQNVHSIPGNHEYYCTALEGVIPWGTCDQGNDYEEALDFWTYHRRYPAIVRRATSDGAADSVDFILFDSSLLIIQERDRWRPVLDSLEKILRISGASRDVSWRILVTHHSPYSVGAHGGYRLWLADEKRVGYLGNCIEEEQDPLKYVEQMIATQQDNCTPQYRAYTDSLMATINRVGTKVQMLIAGHDHSLQLLNLPDSNSTCESCPKIFVITGAGSKRATVRSSRPPEIFTHPFNTPDQRGKSAAGFAVCRFIGERLEVSFIESERGDTLSMGGVTNFRIDREGRLLGTE